MYREIYNELKRREREMQKTAAMPDAILRLLGRSPAPARPNILKKLLPLLGLGAAGGAVAAIPEAREAVSGAASTVGGGISDLWSQLTGGSEPQRPGRNTKKTNAIPSPKPEPMNNPAGPLQGILSALGATPGRIGQKTDPNPLATLLGNLGLEPSALREKKTNAIPAAKPPIKPTRANPVEVVKLLRELGVNIGDYFGNAF